MNSDDNDVDSDPFLEEESSSSEDYDDEYWFNTSLQGIKENDPFTRELEGDGSFERIRNMTDEEWEELGRDISNNTHLETVNLINSALNDHKMSFLFRGLTRSTSIERLDLYLSRIGAEGVRSMVPFLQNANNLTNLDIDYNNINSAGFNMLFQALRSSPIELLRCNNCGIESIEIDSNSIPQNLRVLRLRSNRINADGCRGLAKLLQWPDSALADLWLENNQIDDEGVAILIDALQNNTSLKELDLSDNEGVSAEGAKLCLRLVNDVSSIKATLQSNHTLQILTVENIHYDDDDDVMSIVQQHIANVLRINYRNVDQEAASREKLIRSQLHSGTRAKLAELQGVDRSLYSEINPLHLPEVLALVGRHHGQGELYVALKSSIAGVISIVNRKQCIQELRAYYLAKLKELDAELASINEAEGGAVETGSESRSNTRSPA